MNKIDRFNGNVKAFASEYQGTERTTFGTTVESDELTQQQTSSYLRGWGIVGSSEDPSLEDFNAAMFTATQYIAYLHQMGVPEWNALQEYPTEGAQVTHSLRSWLRGPDWVSGDEPGIADSTRWKLVVLSDDLGTSAYVNTGSGPSDVPTNGDLGNSSTLDIATAAEITAGVTGKVVTDDKLSSSSYALSEKSLSITMTDATYTLLDSENFYGRIYINGILTAEQDLIVSDDERSLIVKNNTNYAIKVKTINGTGVHVEIGEQFSLRIEGGNVLSDGVKNRIVIADVNTYVSGTSFIYPFSLSQDSLYSIDYYAALTGSNSSSFGHLTHEIIDNSPSSWSSTAWLSASTTSRAMEIKYQSNNSLITVLLGSDTRASAIYGYLKEGVTY